MLPEYGRDWKSKIVVSGLAEDRAYTLFSVVAASPDGREITKRLDAGSYLGIVAATNFKQRIRTMLEYYYADLHNYAVAGTPNRLEYDQGFFVKQGDGAADIKPIAHLYKTQVYQLARFLGLPESIISGRRRRIPIRCPRARTSFSSPFPIRSWISAFMERTTASAPRPSPGARGSLIERVRAIYRDIDRKRLATRFLHAAAASGRSAFRRSAPRRRRPGIPIDHDDAKSVHP